MACYEQSRGESLIWNEAPESFWRHHISAWDDPFVHNDPLRTILQGRLHLFTTGTGEPVGYARVAAKRWDEKLQVWGLHLDAQVNWQVAAPCLLRALYDCGRQTPAVEENAKPFTEIDFMLGRTHTLYTVLEGVLPLRSVPPYAWYLRVADIPAFIRHIAPVLEARLAGSLLTGYTGEVKIDFYRGGLRLAFEQGRLTLAEPWRAPAYGDEADAGSPPLVFLQLLFGYHSLAELRAFFPDVWTNVQTTLLIDTLFPKQPSDVQSLNNA
jgi:hypothetical protein